MTLGDGKELLSMNNHEVLQVFTWEGLGKVALGLRLYLNDEGRLWQTGCKSHDGESSPDTTTMALGWGMVAP